ncbi:MULTISPECIES: LysE family translocator [unclassified Agarivorans]|uniref:LysE family translocator n=1 Tax=unclassified Agarivorans TaxID=2636026 RepID=UPI003D7D0908
MEYQQLIALVSFAFVSTVTPGPNNIMIMSSGASVGFIRTIPHMLGVVFGFSLMVILLGFGLTGLFTRYPFIHQLLQIACILYLLFLAFKIARSKPVNATHQQYQAMSFLSAAAFQWVNPKAWSMALSAISVYAPSSELNSVLLVSLIFSLINLPSVGIWAAAGKQLQTFLTAPNKIRAFNYCMAGLLVISVIPMV